jgi:hypothetical protein
LARQRKLEPTGRAAALKATRVAAVEGRSPPAPVELMRIPVYQQASQRGRIRLVNAWGTPAWTVLVRQMKP